MGWYTDFQKSDWYQAVKDVGDGIANLYDQTSFANAAQSQKNTLGTVEAGQEPNAVTPNLKDLGNTANQAVSALSTYKPYLLGAGLLFGGFLLYKASKG